MANPEQHAPLARLLGLGQRRMIDHLMEQLAAAGFGDQRLAHNNVFPFVPSEGIRLTDLAERAGMTKQAMAELVVDLEQLGYLQRSPDPSDRRAKIIEFTDKGWAAIEVALGAFRSFEADLESRIGATRLRQLRRTLLEILD